MYEESQLLSLSRFFTITLFPVNGQFPQWDGPEGNRGSCIHHLGLDICFDEYNYYDYLLALLIEEIGH